MERSLSWIVLCWKEISNFRIVHVLKRTWKELQHETFRVNGLSNGPFKLHACVLQSLHICILIRIRSVIRYSFITVPFLSRA